MNRLDMPRVETSSEAPGHLRVSIGFFPSLSIVIVGPDVLVHLLQKLLQSLWGLLGEILRCWSWMKSLYHSFNNNLIWHRWRLRSETQKPSGIHLQVFLVVLCALE